MFDHNQPAYIALAKAIAESKAPLVFFVGSGLSGEVKLPTWRELRSKLEELAHAKIRTIETVGGRILHGKLEAAKAAPDYWLAFQLTSSGK